MRLYGKVVSEHAVITASFLLHRKFLGVVYKQLTAVLEVDEWNLWRDWNVWMFDS